LLKIYHNVTDSQTDKVKAIHITALSTAELTTRGKITTFNKMS